MGGHVSQAPGTTQSDLSQNLNTSQGLVGTSASQGADLFNFATQALGKRDTLMQPYIKQQQDLASGVNGAAAVNAASLPLGSLQAQKAATKQQIMNTIPPGATRDYALAEADRNATSSTYDFIRSATLQAPQNLANVGQTEGQIGLSAAGAGQSGLNTALSGSNNLYGTGLQAKLTQDQIDAQRRAATLSFLGSLAGTATGGIVGGNLFGGGGAKAPAPPTYYPGVINGLSYQQG